MNISIKAVRNDNEPQCQYFVVRKKRLCRMTVRPGRNYCGEHEPEPMKEDGQCDTRIPCPYDSKHTCYASKLEKHLAICNARQGESPQYIVHNINSPAESSTCPRTPLNKVARETLMRVIEKVHILYEKILQDQIPTLPEQPIHFTVLKEFSESDRAESSLRHLRQSSTLLHVAENEGLVSNRTCYVELGAGKGQLSFYACSAWCAPDSDSRVLLVDRASLRHKRDNKLRGASDRVRADLAHLALERVPAVAQCTHLVGLAKHLCGVATDYALRCITADGVVGRTRGIVLATCCHHRCDRDAYIANSHLLELGITGDDLNVMLGIVSWATCGDGRSRDRKNEPKTSQESEMNKETESDPKDQDKLTLSQEYREQIGREAKALLDWGRVLYLKQKGFDAKLCYYVPTTVSLENVCIVASKVCGPR